MTLQTGPRLSVCLGELREDIVCGLVQAIMRAHVTLRLQVGETIAATIWMGIRVIKY